MAYAQDHGSTGMQKFVHNQQRKLQAHIEDAKEWASARENAAFEAIDDWSLLCQSSEKPCPHGANCTYRKAVEQIFDRNRATVDVRQLARALREVLKTGPKKTCRVPFLVGPSNTGKSTIVYPFDDLFSPRRVLHKPALGSTFGLRNLVGGVKRFIFWDDFRPVEFAHEMTVPVSLFLSLFVGQYSEIQVSQSFNDGNKDVQWNHGVIFTGKQEGLWAATKRISPEDVKHMRNRVLEFPFTQTLPEGSLTDVVSCAPCMSDWIVRKAAELDAAPALQPVLPVQMPGEARFHEAGHAAMAIHGFQELVAAARLPESASGTLLEDLVAIGAVSVSELTTSDWECLRSWGVLRPLQKRRLLQHVCAM